MSHTLVIVESPTKAKTISKFLGKDFQVESSFGHVRDLPKSKMGVDIEGGTFEPTYTTSRDKSKQIKKLKDAAKKSDRIIFATDEDREGEAISWHLAHILKIEPEKAQRIVFHEITKSAINAALENPRGIDQKLVDAQQARRVLDRLVGYELSPFLWKKVARGLSAGRVQSVAVRLVVEREREREAFKPEEYWTLEGHFRPANANHEKHDIVAKLSKIDGKKLDKLGIGNKSEMDAILKDLKDATYSIENLESKETKRNAPPPFTTSTLQQRANSKFGFSARQTMRLAQQLYEGINIGSDHVGLITYMRTDSQNLSAKFLEETKKFVGDTYGSTYALDTPRRYKTKSKGAQEAHEAIRPTDPARTPESIKGYLDDRQYKLYSLIWARAVATQMATAKLLKTTIDISGKQYMFRATGQSMVFDGWLKLYPQSVKEEMLPELKKGQGMDCLKLTDEQHFTEPPARYSDATLVKALEEYGIGRPSTYAPTIGTIESRGYVQRDDNKRLFPADVAYLVNDLLVEHFSNVVDYKFTALMEENLDAIAEGKKDWQPIISTFYHPFHENLEKKTDELSRQDIQEMTELGTDPKDGKPIYVRIGRYGPYVQKGVAEDDEKPRFASIPKGKSMHEVTLEEALTYLSLPRVVGEDENGNPYEVNIGRFGPYVKYAGKFYSIKDDDPYTISFEKAKQIIQEKLDAEAKSLIKQFPGTTIIVKVGRYGPYITDGEKNAKIPKDTTPEDLTQDQCEQLLKEAPKKGTRRRKTKKKA